MTLPEIIYSIKEKLSDYVIVDDFPIADGFIISKINSWRAAQLRELYKAKLPIDGRYYQKVCCLEIKCEKEICTIDGMEISGSALSYINIPNLVLNIGEQDIIYLGPTLFEKNSYSRKTLVSFINSEGNILTGNKPMYVVIGNKIYFKNLPDGNHLLCAVWLLEDPRMSCNWELDTSQYPVPSYNELEILVMRDLMSAPGYADKFNNANFDKERVNQKTERQDEK